jgi:hypothetical protein
MWRRERGDGLKSRHARVVLALLVTCGVWTAITVARFTLPVRSGLPARYFPTTDWTGPPARTVVDRAISTEQLSRSWGFAPPDAFSVSWSGYLFVNRPGLYTLATTSDDGSLVYIDGRLIVDNRGAHSSITRDGRIRLERGSHQVVLLYSQLGGAFELEWRWARDREPLTPVPDWLLSPRPWRYRALVAARWLEWIWRALAVASVLLAARLSYQLGYWPRRQAGPDDAAESLSPLPGDHHRGLHGTGARGVLCLILFVVVTLIQTWPLATDPAHLSRNDNGDTLLNEWTLAWVAHQLPRRPLQLFDGNMFYPEHRTLAYSEALIVQSVMAAPFLWLGASPVLAYNLVLLAGFALTGWVTCLVVATWTEDWTAGIAAGLMVAFNAHTLTRLPHLQAQHVEFLPLALLSLDRVLQHGRWRSAYWLALSFTLQALTSVYLLVFSAVAMVTAVLVRPEDWLGKRFTTVVSRLALSFALTVTALTPFLLPYWHLHDQGFVRSLDEEGSLAAVARDYLTTTSRFHSYAGGRFALFPGMVALTLAAVAVVSRIAFTDARARMCLAFGLCGVVLSLGPSVVPGYELLYSTLPILPAIRTTSRFGYLGLVGVAIVGGYGVAVLRRRLARQTIGKHVFSVVVLVLVGLEPLVAPIDLVPFNGIPSIYALPATEANAVVVELPFPPPEFPFRNAPYLLNSTLNWKPLLNGYSGFLPASYVQHYAAMSTFPRSESIRAMEAAGVTHAFVHLVQFSSKDIDAIEQDPSLHRLALDESVALYRIDRARTP